MWYLTGNGTLTREMSWQVGTNNEDGQECLKVALHLNSCSRITEALDARERLSSLDSLRSILATEDTWLVPGLEVWDVDLDGLRERFKQFIPDLALWQWFTGWLSLRPDITIDEREISGETQFETFASVQIESASIGMLDKFSKVVMSNGLAQVLNRRWEEGKRTFAVEAFMSTIILLGSVLEGVLLAKVRQMPAQAGRTTSAPKDRAGRVKPVEDWTLENLIAVSHESHWIGKDTRDFSAALRDYRNLVHPGEQERQAFYPDAGTCRVSREVVEAVLEDLSK